MKLKGIKKIFRGGHHPDYMLLALVFILTLGGLVALASASSDLGKIKFDDSIAGRIIGADL